MLSDILSKIIRLIGFSSLPQKKQEELVDVIAQADDKEHKLLLDLFTSDSSWIEKLSENLTKKREALAAGDRAAWQKIIEQEVNELEKISEK